MISITSSSFSQKIKVIVQRDSVQIMTQPIIGYPLLLSLLAFQAFVWGIPLLMSHDTSFGTMSTIMFVIFMLFVLYFGKKTISINPETRKVYVTTWQSRENIKWKSDMKLNYVRMFNDSDKLSGVSLSLSNLKDKENTLVVFENENDFLEFLKVYNQKYPGLAIL